MNFRFLFIFTFLSLYQAIQAIQAQNIIESQNIYNNSLEKCSENPKTGFYRDGYCNTGENDNGTHVICAKVTNNFLDFSKSKGNDLITAKPNFPGLKDGDYWCLCALRWLEAYNTNNPSIIPKIKPEATHKKMLDFTSLNALEKYKNNL